MLQNGNILSAFPQNNWQAFDQQKNTSYMPLLNLPENQRIRTGMIPEENLSTIQNVATRTAAVIETNLLTQPDTPSRPLVLKVVDRTNYSNQQFEINDSRCIIGSGERANIQMQHPALTPYHCEFVRNPAGIYVRQIGAEILVNGQMLPEAWIYSGDKIQMGNYDLEVVDVGQFIMSELPAAVENQTPEPPQETAVDQPEATVDRQEAAVDQQDNESVEPEPPLFDNIPAVESHPLIAEPACDSPASFISPVEKPHAVEETFVEAPAVEATLNEAPVAEETFVEAPVAEETFNETPVVEEIFNEAPVVEETFSEAPVAEVPVNEIPGWETPEDEAPAVEAPVVSPVLESAVAETCEANLSEDPVQPLPFVDNGDDIISETLGQVQEELASGGVETPPGMASNLTGEIHNPQDDQARWLDELYESAVDEEVETTPPLNPESHGWTDDSVAPQLMQPNVDPGNFKDLPNPTTQESNRVLDQIEGVLKDGAAESVEEPAQSEPGPAVSEATDESESSWQQEWHRQEQEQVTEEGPTAAPTAFSSLLGQLEQEAAAAENETPAATSEFVEQPIAEQASAPAAPQPTAEPVVEPAVESFAESTDEPFVEPAAEAFAEDVIEEPATVAEPAVEDETKDEVKIESVADVLARLRAAGSLDYDVPASEIEAAISPQTPIEVFVDANANSLENPGEEESVQDYMNQLMQRLRKDGGNAARPGAEGLEIGEESPEDQPASPPVQDKNEEEDLSPENPMLPGEFVPNDVAPEQTSTLDALRQVANQSVENAIKRSAREKSNETSLIYLGASTACLFLSAVLFVLSKGVFDMAFILAVVFAIGCVACGFMFLSIGSAKEKMRARKNNKKLEARMKARG